MNDWTTSSLQKLLDERGPALQLYARQFCDAPDDAVQEALVELVQQATPPERILPWLYTVVKRRALNLARSESRRVKHQQDAVRRRDWFASPDTDRQEADQCQALLRRLPTLEREIVTARIWGELSFAEIAELVQQPLSTVHRRYRQALVDLQSIASQTPAAGKMEGHNEVGT